MDKHYLIRASDVPENLQKVVEYHCMLSPCEEWYIAPMAIAPLKQSIIEAGIEIYCDSDDIFNVIAKNLETMRECPESFWELIADVFVLTDVDKKRECVHVGDGVYFVGY